MRQVAVQIVIALFLKWRNSATHKILPTLWEICPEFVIVTPPYLPDFSVMENLITIISSGAVSVVLSGAVMWLSKSWISERIKNAIAYEYAEKLKAVEHGYNQQLEKLRAQLQSESIKSKEEIEHDRKIFERLISYCGEITFRDVCTSIGDYQFYDWGHFKGVRDWEHYGIQDENQFVNQNLREAFQKLHKSLEEFTTVVGRNFFNTSEGRYMLYPELRHSGDEEDHRIYEDALTETKNASDKTLAAFSEFRQAVKQLLYV